MNDLGKAFSSFFKDQAWFTKTLIAAVFMILSVVGIGLIVLAGYFVQITQRVMRHETPVLPPWNAIGRKFVVGFKFCLVYVVYLSPILLLLLPVAFMLAAASGADEAETIPIIISVYTFGFTLLFIPYGILLTLASPVILYRFAERERIGDAVNIVKIARLCGRNWQNTLVVSLVGIGIQCVAPAGTMLFGVGIFFTVFYSFAVSAHMSGLLGLEVQKQEQVP
jgi:hypothetical protein